MILPAQAIRRLAQAGMIEPFTERGVAFGRSYGLGPCTYDVRLKQDIWLWPFWGRLASTIETFDIPNDIVVEVKDKSSNARIFVLVQNTLIDPGFKGGLTLELTRFLPWPVRLRAGMPIAQLKFSELTEATEMPYRGKYYGQSAEPEPARYEAA
ncbi:dCTP deaminase [Methylobacterium fujisawaense]